MSSPPKTLNPNPNESWTIVSGRRNRKHKSKPKPSPRHVETLILRSPIPWSPLDSQIDPNCRAKTLTKLNSSLHKLKSSKFYSQFLFQLQSPEVQSGLSDLLSFDLQFQLVVYGIGSIESGESPRLQLSLALLLYEQLKHQISSIEVFDPVISATELAVIEELGVTVMKMDEQGRREVKVPTLFFMPHCEVQLYDNLLHANWGRDRLNRMIVLGNSFGEYERYAHEKTSLRGSVEVEEVGTRVLKSTQFIREVVVEEGEESDDAFFRAFHDISWHFFDVQDDMEMEIHVIE